MTMGLHTLVTDVGTGLSLDEATSHLDLHSERCVNEAVRAMQLTRVVVAHRPETIAVADRVVAMAGGRIASDSAIGAVPMPIPG